MRSKIVLLCCLLLLSYLSYSQKTINWDSIFSLPPREHNVLSTYYLSVIFAKKDTYQIKNFEENFFSKSTYNDKLIYDYEKEIQLRLQLIDSASIIRLYENQIEKFKTADNPLLKAKIYYEIGEFYTLQKDAIHSLENKLYCLDLLKLDPLNKYFDQNWMLYQIAYEFFRFKDFKKSALLATTAFEGIRLTTPNAHWFDISCSDLIAMSYFYDGQQGNAQKWLDTSMYYAVKYNGKDWIGIISGNKASILEKNGQYVQAIPLYTIAIENCKIKNLYDNIIPFAASLSNCYIKTGDLIQAASALKKSTNGLVYEHSAASNKKNYEAAVHFYKATNQYAKAITAQDSLIYYTALLDEEFSSTKKVQAEAQFAYEKKLLETTILVQKDVFKKRMVYALSIGIILLCIISLLLIKRQRLTYTLNQIRLETEKKKVEIDLVTAKEAISQFVKNIQEKNEAIYLIRQQLESQQKPNNVAPAPYELSTEIPNSFKEVTILTEKDWAEFKRLFDLAYPSYRNRLTEKHPTLTVAETRFFMLQYLGQSTKEMANTLGVSLEAIRNIKFRIRKKLNILANEDINASL